MFSASSVKTTQSQFFETWKRTNLEHIQEAVKPIQTIVKNCNYIVQNADALCEGRTETQKANARQLVDEIKAECEKIQGSMEIKFTNETIFSVVEGYMDKFKPANILGFIEDFVKADTMTDFN